MKCSDLNFKLNSKRLKSQVNILKCTKMGFNQKLNRLKIHLRYPLHPQLPLAQILKKKSITFCIFRLPCTLIKATFCFHTKYCFLCTLATFFCILSGEDSTQAQANSPGTDLPSASWLRVGKSCGGHFGASEAKNAT